MDLLRFLSRLPARLAELTKRLFQIISSGAGPALRAVFGNVSFSWSRPDWMGALAADIRKQPRRYGGGALAMVTAVLFTWAGWAWSWIA